MSNCEECNNRNAKKEAQQKYYEEVGRWVALQNAWLSKAYKSDNKTLIKKKELFKLYEEVVISWSSTSKGLHKLEMKQVKDEE